MAIIPFWMAYVVSDFFFLIAYYLLSYRKKVVIENLRKVFPEKDDRELHKIMVKFYHYLSDLMIESLKGISMTKAQVLKRHKMINPEVLHPYYERNINIIGVSGHFGNWEWGALSGGIQIQQLLIAFYKPLSNPYLDRYMRKRRAQFNCRLASIKDTFSTFESTQGQNVAYMMVADQSPSNLQDAYWLKFLDQDTACLHGPEKYARMYRLPVFYLDIQRKKRGFYELELSLLSEDVATLEHGKLTELFMHRLEEIIRTQPEYWLWSHKRWKHQRGQ